MNGINRRVINRRILIIQLEIIASSYAPLRLFP